MKNLYEQDWLEKSLELPILDGLLLQDDRSGSNIFLKNTSSDCQMEKEDIGGTAYSLNNQQNEVSEDEEEIIQREPRNSLNYELEQLVQKESDNSIPNQEKKTQRKRNTQLKYKYKRRRLKPVKKIKKPKENLKGETKNIPKNYGKQIIKFILQNRHLTEQVLSGQNYTFDQMCMYLKEKKKHITKISDLRSLWIQSQFSKTIRTLKALPWIWNSRIQNREPHIKYRAKILQGVMNPYQFSNLKDF